MLDRAQTIEKLKSTREYLSEHYGVSSMLLFGSVARFWENYNFEQK